MIKWCMHVLKIDQCIGFNKVEYAMFTSPILYLRVDGAFINT